MEVYDALGRARSGGRRVVLVTVVAVRGEAPSRTGAKLVADGEGVIAGTLGCSEFDAAGAALAVEALESSGPLRRVVGMDDEDDPRTVELFAEVHDPEPAVIVLGSNPVARALVAQARLLGRRAVLVAPGGDTAVAGGVEVKADDPERYLLAAPPGPHDCVLVSDHDAPWVDTVLRIALASAAAYVGMLGSRRHAPAAVQRLRDAGVPEHNVVKLRSPCGLDIGSQTPEEIALSIVAEMVAAERNRPGGPLPNAWSAT
jgi:xanthine dehydrogenase accessory factor